MEKIKFSSIKREEIEKMRSNLKVHNNGYINRRDNRIVSEQIIKVKHNLFNTACVCAS